MFTQKKWNGVFIWWLSHFGQYLNQEVHKIKGAGHPNSKQYLYLWYITYRQEWPLCAGTTALGPYLLYIVCTIDLLWYIEQVPLTFYLILTIDLLCNTIQRVPLTLPIDRGDGPIFVPQHQQHLIPDDGGRHLAGKAPHATPRGWYCNEGAWGREGIFIYDTCRPVVQTLQRRSLWKEGYIYKYIYIYRVWQHNFLFYKVGVFTF